MKLKKTDDFKLFSKKLYNNDVCFKLYNQPRNKPKMVILRAQQTKYLILKNGLNKCI